MQAVSTSPGEIRAFCQPPALPDALDSAVLATVSEYRRGRRRGAAALGPVIGMHPGTLANKASPTCSAQQLTLREAVLVMAVAGRYEILHALTLLLAHVAVPLPDFSRCSDAALLDLWAGYLEAQGRHAASVRRALADGLVDAAELQEVRAALQLAMTAGLEFCGRLEGLSHERCHPRGRVSGQPRPPRTPEGPQQSGRWPASGADLRAAAAAVRP